VTESSTESSIEDSTETSTEPVADVGGTEQPPQRLSLLLGVALLADYIGLVLTAVLARPAVFLTLLVLGQVLDLLVISDGYVRPVLGRAQFGIATRSSVRELMTATLAVVTMSWAVSGDRHALAFLVVASGGLRLLYQLLLVAVRRRVVPPVLTRNLDLTGLRRAPQPPPTLLGRVSERQHALSAVAMLGAAIGIVTGSPPTAYGFLSFVLVVELGLDATLAGVLLASRHAPGRAGTLAAVHTAVAELRPEVMLYHSGDADSAYQVNMWLSTVDQLPYPVIVALRERSVFEALGPTESPVVCVPSSVDFMTFPLLQVRVAMYTANVGKTIHMLREPGVQHVFIGHGDSDKSASSNPYSKVYSEIWVAGPAGRDRYARAAVEIRDEDIVEVGRPQLAAIAPATATARPADAPFTVLYAPTWEGWVNDPTHSSVVRTGLRLVERLLAMPDVRVVYKPHPLTGSVSAAFAAADARIREAMQNAIRLRGSAGHLLAIEPEPGLFDFFNSADVLVADISSVLSDFVASQKPYVVPNLTPLSDEDFRVAFPSASAAYLLDRDAERIADVLAVARGADPMAPLRRDLKHYVLGPDEPSAMTRFAAAVEAAHGRAVSRCPVRSPLGVVSL
jgi:hypothetical protein